MPLTRPLRRLLAGALVTAGTLTAAPAALAAESTSTNWAGYVASRSGVTYRHVVGTWVQPAATCTAGAARRTYSAAWVGLGGYHTTSSALEQIGTEADCLPDGTASYSAWYELVPEASATIKMTVRPGDRLTGAVTVKGTAVTLRLVDHTTGAAFTTTRTAAAVDVTSAEWIVEAPSLCHAGGGRCETMPLANFATIGFTSAAATTAGGHTGTIADAAWHATSIDLQDGTPGRRFADARHATLAAGGAASTGALAPSGKAFTVTYEATETTAEPQPPYGSDGAGGPTF